MTSTDSIKVVTYISASQSSERERERERERDIYIYIYIYEIGSSYTWCNLTKVTPFVDRRFVIDLMVKKNSIKC